MVGNKRIPNGFSLLEVLIAMSILSIGLLAVVGLFVNAFKALQIGDRRTVATQLARNKMEALRLSAIPDSNGQDQPEGMTRNWSIQKSGMNEKIWVVTVQVRWKNADRRDQGIVLKSFLFL